MNLGAPMTMRADVSRPMPAGAGARFDTAEAAVASLREEQRRLQRLGLETPLARCHEQLRYWTFVRALFSMSPEVNA